MTRSRASILVASFLTIGALHAQDIHFSQFFHTPLANGPGSIGAFDGDYRINGIYRQQWRSVTRPYRTFGLGADAANFLRKKGLGAGIWIFNDRTGDARLNTFHFSIGGSYSRAFDKQRQAVSAGLQFGFTSITLDPNELAFDSQYNGYYYDPALSTGEDLQRDGLVHPDLHAGIRYRYRPVDRQVIEVGLSFFNLTRPGIGFLDSPPEPLDLRTSFQVLTGFPVAERFDLLPVVQYMAQGPFRELDLGAIVRYILLQRYTSLRTVRLGALYRAADAGTIYAGMEYDDWTAGISYDINFSDLVPASRNRGGIEFTVTRILRRNAPVPARFKACPAQL
ncbi:MAG: PorP/SprF family type IX secretion system membrane protein [Flavobacteriales bacterium]|nr:PorP/SprF family type IX secretion system membrane protein [Flavobacteriales bacterium]MCB9194486.1 PorP/SprF family type IX secretion system membrane protein [Flavobacteriales bacterium]